MAAIPILVVCRFRKYGHWRYGITDGKGGGAGVWGLRFGTPVNGGELKCRPRGAPALACQLPPPKSFSMEVEEEEEEEEAANASLPAGSCNACPYASLVRGSGEAST